MKNTKRTEEKVNAIIDEILDEDQENNFNATRIKNCPRDCEELDNTSKEISRQCKCGVENSTRFSLRVLEAMRLLQRDVDQPSTSSIDDIVDYIRTNYRHDGDLYAQVRTALRQVCSQGFVMELLDNEYYLIGPVVSAMKPNGCSLDCEDRISKMKNRKIRKTFVDRDQNSIGEPKFHSTRISANEINNADYRDTEELDTEELLPSCACNDTSDIRDDRQRRVTEIREIERRDERAEPIPGPSRDFARTVSPTPARNAKEPRLEDRIVQRADENDEETTTEEDMDCTCDTNGVTQIIPEPSRRRPLDRSRIVRNGQRRENGEEEEDEDEEAEQVKEEDEDAEDSVYRELRVRGPRRKRNAAHERELKRWIRRCRRECERRAQ